ncbi:MAG: hypothetical protein RL018_1431, partial [Pseudomonadota bacterium]
MTQYITPVFSTVGIVGTGAMGRGIAQIAAQAGSRVVLFDAAPDAGGKALAAIVQQWEKLAEKGRLTQVEVAQRVALLSVAVSNQDLAPCDLVVEAIVENLKVKQSVLSEIEGIVSSNAVLVSNTSSLSVTAIAAGLKRPTQFAGFHFFNPVPLMKVVEVIAGLKTEPTICAKLAVYAQ